jgi:capsular exopolysaccharide synthesis family protein
VHPTSVEAEQYRALRHTVEHLGRTTGLKILAVSSAQARDGKTTTAINLAGALAQAPEARVLLVEADLRRAAVGQYLGLHGTGVPGLVDAILTPGLTLAELAQPRPPYNLSVLLAGELPAAPYEVLKSPRLGELLEEARQRFDYVILDTPPIVPVPDCRVIGKWVDGFLVVVSAHRTPRKLVEEALNLMEPSKLIGLVFNNDTRPLGNSYASAVGDRRRDGDRE